MPDRTYIVDAYCARPVLRRHMMVQPVAEPVVTKAGQFCRGRRALGGAGASIVTPQVFVPRDFLGKSTNVSGNKNSPISGDAHGLPQLRRDLFDAQSGG